MSTYGCKSFDFLLYSGTEGIDTVDDDEEIATPSEIGDSLVAITFGIPKL